MNNRCQRCGLEYTPSDIFCKSCGSIINRNQNVTLQQENQFNNNGISNIPNTPPVLNQVPAASVVNSTQMTPKKSNTALIITLAVLLLVVSGTLLYIIFTRDTDTKKENNSPNEEIIPKKTQTYTIGGNYLADVPNTWKVSSTTSKINFSNDYFTADLSGKTGMSYATVKATMSSITKSMESKGYIIESQKEESISSNKIYTVKFKYENYSGTSYIMGVGDNTTFFLDAVFVSENSRTQYHNEILTFVSTIRLNSNMDSSLTDLPKVDFTEFVNEAIKEKDNTKLPE